jgi:hypothetical protein
MPTAAGDGAGAAATAVSTTSADGFTACPDVVKVGSDIASWELFWCKINCKIPFYISLNAKI